MLLQIDKLCRPFKALLIGRIRLIQYKFCVTYFDCGRIHLSYFALYCPPLIPCAYFMTNVSSHHTRQMFGDASDGSDEDDASYAEPQNASCLAP